MLTGRVPRGGSPERPPERNRTEVATEVGVANNSDINRSRRERFLQSVGRWLEKGQLPLGVQIFVGVFLFVAGVGFQRLFELGLIKVFRGDQGKIWLIVVLYILSAIVLTIVASIWISSLRAIILRVTDEHKTTRKDIDRLGLRFGLTAEYIDDGARTYRRTQELVENAKESLTFVDWWVASPDGDRRSPARTDYYQAITDRIEKHLKASRDDTGARGDFSHQRIVQVPEDVNLENVASVLKKDTVYWEHLKKCVELQEDNEDITSVYIARPFTHTHFAIIDDKYLVQPILTTGKSGLRRHGAIFYTDPHGELIKRYKEMMRRLYKHTVEKEHIT